MPRCTICGVDYTKVGHAVHMNADHPEYEGRMPDDLDANPSGAKAWLVIDPIEVFRSFEGPESKNAERALRKARIPYRLTRSKEGSKGQFKMVEFHVNRIDIARAHNIIDTEINSEPRWEGGREERIL